MGVVTVIGGVLAAVIALLGIIGGLLALPGKIRAFRIKGRSVGDRGTEFFIMSRQDTPEHTEAEFLVTDDLIHFLTSFGKIGGQTETLDVKRVGEFYRVRMRFRAGVLQNLMKVPKQ
jgi:hypothetical protein